MSFFGGGQAPQPPQPDPLFAGTSYFHRPCMMNVLFQNICYSPIKLTYVLSNDRVYDVPRKQPNNEPQLAQTEMEMYTVLFNKLTSSCFTKCASRKHKEGDLQLGEMSCLDRCVSKYMEAQEKVGTVMQQANEKQAQQMQQMQQMQTNGGT